jgi:hypothetical protein
MGRRRKWEVGKGKDGLRVLGDGGEGWTMAVGLGHSRGALDESGQPPTTPGEPWAIPVNFDRDPLFGTVSELNRNGIGWIGMEAALSRHGPTHWKVLVATR